MIKDGFSSIGVIATMIFCVLVSTVQNASSTTSKDPQKAKVVSNSTNNNVFGSISFPVQNLPISSRWEKVYGAMEGCGDAAVCRNDDPVMKKLARDMRREGLLEKLKTVNTFINHSIKYRSDKDLYGVVDYWATPEEILKNKAGDCEDFAILKMFALIEARVLPEIMAIVVVRDQEHEAYHAVLSVSSENEILILDILKDDVLNDTAYKSYLPLYSLSTGNTWVHGFRNRPGLAANSRIDIGTVAPGFGPYWANSGQMRCCRALPYRW